MLRRRPTPMDLDYIYKGKQEGYRETLLEEFLIVVARHTFSYIQFKNILCSRMARNSAYWMSIK